MRNQRDLVHYVLKNWAMLPDADFTVQGFGFLRVRIAPDLRIHVWDSSLRIPGVSDVHDHAQWDFESWIMSGQVVNIRYLIAHPEAAGLAYKMATIVCGQGGGMQSSAHEDVILAAQPPELYVPGDAYSQQAAEIHRTMPTDGAVTLIRQKRTDVETARVFWPEGSEWVDAIPRVARSIEVERVVTRALAVWS